MMQVFLWKVDANQADLKKDCNEQAVAGGEIKLECLEIKFSFIHVT